MKNTFYKKISQFVLRLSVAFLVISSLFFFFGHVYMKLLLPVVSYGIEQCNAKYEILDVTTSKVENIVQTQYTIRTHESFIDQEGIVWPASDQTVGIQSYTLYIHPIILFSLLLAWPFLSKKKKLQAALISIPLLIIVELVDVPVILLYTLKESYNIINIHWSHEFWSYFLNSGGRQFLAILVFFVSIKPFQSSDKKATLFRV